MAFFASARQSCNLWVMRMCQSFYKIQKGLLIDNKDSEGWQKRQQFSRGNIFKNICPQFFSYFKSRNLNLKSRHRKTNFPCSFCEDRRDYNSLLLSHKGRKKFETRVSLLIPRFLLQNGSLFNEPVALAHLKV